MPLIAIAPLVRRWGAQIEIGSFRWENEHSVSLIAAYLAFFPIAVGALRGLKSPERTHLELMHAYGIGWWRDAGHAAPARRACRSCCRPCAWARPVR